MDLMHVHLSETLVFPSFHIGSKTDERQLFTRHDKYTLSRREKRERCSGNFMMVHRVLNQELRWELPPLVLSTSIPVLAPRTKHDGQLPASSCAPTLTLTSNTMMRSAGNFLNQFVQVRTATDPHPRDLMACVQVFLLHVVDACTSALNVSVAGLAKPQGDTDRFP